MENYSQMNLEEKIIEAKIRKVLTTPLHELMGAKKKSRYQCFECRKDIEKSALGYETLKLLNRHHDSEECAEKGRIRYIEEMDPGKIAAGHLRDYAKKAIEKIKSEKLIRYPITELKDNNSYKSNKSI